jgi:hypothetical protein
MSRRNAGCRTCSSFAQNEAVRCHLGSWSANNLISAKSKRNKFKVQWKRPSSLKRTSLHETENRSIKLMS